jgi:hypothetical protein
MVDLLRIVDEGENVSGGESGLGLWPEPETQWEVSRL